MLMGAPMMEQVTKQGFCLNIILVREESRDWIDRTLLLYQDACRIEYQCGRVGNDDTVSREDAGQDQDDQQQENKVRRRILQCSNCMPEAA
jgi:hypothetical protein